ncbi:MAG TPA: hypothetical protein VGH52_01860 [Gaiellaceae bacterium]|jgi:hypothetical protein
MTLTTLITVNAVLGAAVVYGLLRLLTHGVQTSRHQALRAQVHELPRHETDRIAA